jgi:hypothetical protein
LRNLGFSRVIVTLYSMRYDLKSSPEYVSKMAKSLNVYAITAPDELMTDDYIAGLDMRGTRYFVHTVNSAARAAELLEMGAAGIYSDTLVLSENSSGGGASAFSEVKFSAPAEKIASLNAAISKLPKNSRAALENYLIYRSGAEYALSGGVAEPLSDGSLTSCFENGGEMYAPLYKTVLFLGGKNYKWLPEESAVSFEYGGSVFRVKQGNSYEVITSGGGVSSRPVNGGITSFCDCYFAPESFFREVFDCHTFRFGEYMWFARQKSA